MHHKRQYKSIDFYKHLEKYLTDIKKKKILRAQDHSVLFLAFFSIFQIL